jgi:hypothetical protein
VNRQEVGTQMTKDNFSPNDACEQMQIHRCPRVFLHTHAASDVAACITI